MAIPAANARTIAARRQALEDIMPTSDIAENEIFMSAGAGGWRIEICIVSSHEGAYT